MAERAEGAKGQDREGGRAGCDRNGEEEDDASDRRTVGRTEDEEGWRARTPLPRRECLYYQARSPSGDATRPTGELSHFVSAPLVAAAVAVAGARPRASDLAPA